MVELLISPIRAQLADAPLNRGLADGWWLYGLRRQQWPWLTDVVENAGHLQLGYAKGIAAVIGADSTSSAGFRAHSAAGDPVSSEKPGDTGPAVFASTTSLALGTGQAQETQAQ